MLVGVVMSVVSGVVAGLVVRVVVVVGVVVVGVVDGIIVVSVVDKSSYKIHYSSGSIAEGTYRNESTLITEASDARPSNLNCNDELRFLFCEFQFINLLGYMTSLLNITFKCFHE